LKAATAARRIPIQLVREDCTLAYRIARALCGVSV
jgi:hypothetical protein